MDRHLTKPEHEIAYQEIVALVRRHSDVLTPIEILAVAANMVGKLVALQDQGKITPKMAMEVVARNLEAGNQQALHEVMQSQGQS